MLSSFRTHIPTSCARYLRIFNISRNCFSESSDEESYRKRRNTVVMRTGEFMYLSRPTFDFLPPANHICKGLVQPDFIENFLSVYVHSSAATFDDWTCQVPRNVVLESLLFGKSTPDTANYDSYDGVTVNVAGTDVPPPLPSVNFSGLNLHPFLMENLALCGYKQLTPVQRYSIPIALKQRDMMSCASTGSGKTAAFLIPFIDRLLQWGAYATVEERQNFIDQNGRIERRYFPFGLIIVPTREIARQTFAEAMRLTYRTALKVCLFHGGTENYHKQHELLKLGCHLVIATPGRLAELFLKTRIGFRRCRYVVLDEADRMIDIGDGSLVGDIFTSSDLPSKLKRQTTLYSATFRPEIRDMAAAYLREYLFVEVGKSGRTVSTINQRIISTTLDSKHTELIRLLQDSDAKNKRTLVFLRMRDKIESLSQYVWRHGFPNTFIHGGHKQMIRERNMESFRSGRIAILIASDVAARGLDIPDVKHVINFDMPDNIELYIHRIGRTGRVGKEGVATTLFTLRDVAVSKELVQVLEEAGQEVPEFLRKYEEDGIYPVIPKKQQIKRHNKNTGKVETTGYRFVNYRRTIIH